MFSYREQKRFLLNAKVGVLTINKQIAFRLMEHVDKEFKQL